MSVETCIGIECRHTKKNENAGIKASRKQDKLVLNSLDRTSQDVRMVRLSIVCPDRPEIELSQPFISNSESSIFTLKEGTKYRLKFSFIVSNKNVSGLKYENMLWKSGIRVDRSIVLLGAFKPHENPYTYQLKEETLPSGFLVRGIYSARAKVIDDDGVCYMDMHYRFDIKKKWS